MPYVLDTDVLVRAKNDHYKFALCPGFWDWLIRANEAGEVFSTDAVFADILRYMQADPGNPPDELTAWARQRGTGFFLLPTGSTQYAMQAVASWARSGDYREAAIREFLAASDSWLVAEGIARGFTIVTHERSSPESKKKIKIPDACDGQDPKVECISPFEMLSRENVTFVLDRCFQLPS